MHGIRFALFDRSNRLYAALALLMTAGLPGCGSDLPETVPVRGTITLNGSPPPTGGYVNFQPLEPAAGHPTRPGTGRFDADGAFVVQSYDGSQGLVPGSYRVTVECWKSPPNEASSAPAVSYVPRDLRLPDLDVPPASRALDVDYDVPTAVN